MLAVPGCHGAKFPEALHRKYAPSLFSMKDGRSHVKLHGADRARQEDRQQDGIDLCPSVCRFRICGATKSDI